MADQNTEQHGGSTTPDPGEDAPREDDRNEVLDQSPVPDPEAKPTGSSDDPQAD